jgi:hypothetical protein
VFGIVSRRHDRSIVRPWPLLGLGLVLAIPARASELCSDLTTILAAAPSFAALRGVALDKYANKARIVLAGFGTCQTRAPLVDAWGTYICSAGPFDEAKARAVAEPLIAAVATCLPATFEHPAAPVKEFSRNGGWTDEFTAFVQRGGRLSVVVAVDHSFPGGFRIGSGTTPDEWSVQLRVAGSIHQ